MYCIFIKLYYLHSFLNLHMIIYIYMLSVLFELFYIYIYCIYIYIMSLFIVDNIYIFHILNRAHIL